MTFTAQEEPPSSSIPSSHQTQAPIDTYEHIFVAICEGVILNNSTTGRVVQANTAAASMHGYSRETFIGKDPTAYIHANDLTAFQQRLAENRSETVYELTETHIRSNGVSFEVEVCGRAFYFADAWCHLTVVRDISDRLREEQSLRKSVALHMREQATLLDVSRLLASTQEFLPAAILEHVQLLIDCTNAILVVEESGSLVVKAVCGTLAWTQSFPVGMRFKAAEVPAPFLNGHHPIKSSNLHHSDAGAPLFRMLLQDQTPLLVTEVHACLWVPLVGKERVMGGILATHRMPDAFTAHHAELVGSVANQTATHMVNADLHERAQQLAVLEERQRLAQNLHDAVNQSLFSAGLIAEVLPRLWTLDPSAGQQSLEDLKRLIRGAAAEMRGVLAALRPSFLEDADWGDLLQQLASALMGRTNISVKVTIIGAGLLPGPVQVMFYQVCQEAFNNIARHSAASHVRVHFAYNADGVTLEIQDNGHGFDPREIPLGHFGLRMMRERAGAVGALLTITSSPDSGTTLFIQWQG